MFRRPSQASFPSLLDRWLARRVPARALDGVLSDLHDDHARIRAERGRLRAAFWLWREARSVAAAYRLAGDASTEPQPAAWRHLGGDVRQTLRLLARSPGYVATVVLGLGAGLAVSIAMVSVLNTIFHGDGVGITNRETLGSLQVRTSRDGYLAMRSSVSPPELDLLRDARGANVLDVVGVGGSELAARLDSQTGVLPVRFVTPGFFDVLGTRPAAGRMLTDSDHQPEVAAVVIGHRLWHDWFGGADAALGRTLVLAGQAVRIVGVAPERFVGSGAWTTRTAGQEPQLWLPFEAASNWPTSPTAEEAWLAVFVRFAPGASRDAAVADLAPAARAMSAGAGEASRVTLTLNDPFINDLRTDPATMAIVLAGFLGGPIALLLIGCANVANLRLARATARARELAVRASLGATRGQLLRLLSFEAVLLTAGALAVGLVGAGALTRRFGHLIWAGPISLDLAVVGWAVVMAAAVIALSGVAPALLSVRRSTAGALRHTSAGGAAPHARLRHALVVTQIAISVVLLAVGGLFGRSLQLSADTAPRSFEQVVLAELDVEQQGRDATRAAELAGALERRFAADGRVQAVGRAAFDVLGGDVQHVEPAGGGPRAYLRTNAVTPEWFDALGLTPSTGRLFTRSDPPEVAVLTDSAARFLFQDAPAVGRSVDVVAFDGGAWTRSHSLDVVGVVPDTVRNPRSVQSWRSFVYTRLDERPATSVTLAIRTSRPDDVIADLQRELRSADPDLMWSYVQTAARRVDDAGIRPIVTRFAAASAALGGSALALAALGLFAVLAYAVSMRRREIGIRMALGAQAADVTRLVFRLAVRLTLVGVACGFGLALPLAYLMQAVFIGISPFDPLALAPAVGVLLLTALGAGLVPAMRAARVDPVTTLRAE